MFAAGFAVDVERMRGWRRPAAGRALLAAEVRQILEQLAHQVLLGRRHQCEVPLGPELLLQRGLVGLSPDGRRRTPLARNRVQLGLHNLAAPRRARRRRSAHTA